MSISLNAMKKNTAKSEGGSFDNSVYPFWNMDYGKSSVVRFIPYIDPYTQGYWSERRMLPMEFVDSESHELVRFQAPSWRMYGESKCPLHYRAGGLFSEAEKLKNKGRTSEEAEVRAVAIKHWVKITCSYQGFVLHDALKEDNVPENPIRIFSFTKKLHTQIYESVFKNDIDPFDALPCGEFALDDIKRLVNGDLGEDEMEQVMQKIAGYAFVLKKNRQGEYPEWNSGSAWKRSEPHILSDEQLEAIAEYGYHPLHERLPPRPTEEQMEVLKEMQEVSIARAFGDDEGYWNPEWEEAGFKPFRLKSSDSDDDEGGSSTTKKRTSLSDKIASKLGNKTSGATSGAASKTAESVLAKINRKKVEEKVEEPEPEDEDTEEVEATTDVADDANEEVAEVEAAAPKVSQSDLAQRIRDRIKANKK